MRHHHYHPYYYYHDAPALPWKRLTTLWVLCWMVLAVFAERISSTGGDPETTLLVRDGTGIHYAALSGPSGMAAEMLKAHPAGSFSVDDGSQPVFPDRPDAVYFAVAVTGGAKLWGRTLARTLIDMGPPFGNPQGPPLRPIYINLPDSGRFSSKLMTTACDAIDGMPLAGMVIVGDSSAAKSLALAGNAMKVPVLWAKGGIASLHNSYDELSTKLQAILQPSSREIFEAIRATFLQVHWHSYHILCDVDTYVLISGKKGTPLRQKPLNPIIVTLPTNFDLIYKKLAYISRSTKGVVLVLCNLKVARLIMAEAQRMKMLNGHFVWLWMDTTSATEFYDSGQPSYDSKQPLDVGVGLGGRSELETDFYDTFDMRHQSHLADLVERRMEFEDFDPRRKNRTRSYLDGQAVRFGSAALVNPKPDSTGDGSSGAAKHGKNRRPAEKSKNGRKNTANNNTVVNVARRTERFEELAADSDEFEDFDDERTLPLSGMNSEDEQYPMPAGSDGTSEMKLKRSSEYLKLHNTSGHVLFHHNQDFPVGLLALRPIKMKIDRHFIRAAVRLFAATWAKVERDDAPEVGKGGRLAGPWNTQDQSKVPRGQQRPVQMQQKRSVTVRPDTVPTGPEGDTVLTLPVNSANTQQSVHEPSLLGQQQRQQQRAEDEPSQTTPPHGTNDIISPISNSSANLRDVSSTNSSRVKRQSTWWSAATNHKYNPERGGSDRSRGSGRGGATRYKGGCMGTINRAEQAKAFNFAKNLQANARQALSGFPIASGFIEKSLVSHFEMLNLVPTARQSSSTPKGDYPSGDRGEGGRSVNGTAASGMGNTAGTGTATKWRRVGLITGRSVHLDTIIWPGGDVTVSGLAGKAKTMFRVVVSVAPPFVMESPVNEESQCLRGLICYQIYTTGRHNLTLMFNEIERRNRLREINQSPNHYQEEQHQKTRCCYGLSMDLLQKLATEINFDFHLYIVHDGLFGRRVPPPAEPSEPAPRKPTLPINVESKSKFDAQSGRSLKRGSKLKHSQAGMNATREEMPPYPFEFSTAPPVRTRQQWNGVIGDLISGTADLSFAPLSVSKARSEVIDFTIPYFHGGVSLLAAPEAATDIPLLAFLLPFSPELWIAIFTSLNVTAVAVAIYEWLSPFGLNPWGRQRSKNFSMSSALWVMWGLLCGHLVAFKAPKSWPNKFLINVWGGFSVIFIASYTANIAALIAGLLFHNEAKYYEMSMLTQRVGSPIATAAESYVQQNDKRLWEHMKKYQLQSIDEGIERLKNRTIDLLMCDTPILDYYRGTDQSCSLQRIGDNYIEDSYAIGMSKGFPLKKTMSALISKYSNDGYLDILTAKWYGDLPCFRLDREMAQPKPLGVTAVAGVFLLLGVGMVLGVLILIIEHVFYKYTLPILRHQPKDTIWKSRNIMFFSQKLYRFINCVELVSPHHAAKELVHTIRQGQITSLFQKSVKRKEDEQRRRRKSKAQFFEMIQEIRRNIKLDRVQLDTDVDASLSATSESTSQALLPEVHPAGSRLSASASTSRRASPGRLSRAGFGFGKSRDGGSKSSSFSSSLNVRRFSTDSIISERLGTIGRRLSRDAATSSPPDLSHHFETFGKGSSAEPGSSSKFDTYSGKNNSKESVSVFKCDTFNGKLTPAGGLDTVDSGRDAGAEGRVKPDGEEKPILPAKTKKRSRRSPLNLELYETGRRRLIPINERVAQGLAPPFLEADTGSAMLRDKLHEELRLKYGQTRWKSSQAEDVIVTVPSGDTGNHNGVKPKRPSRRT
uniref:Ionotropic glutamate receptor C-terminal domain-containing protein n=1 Tax=Anopheles stephensi TaxID=30069 RepID=A0A182Y0Z7_ANOST